MNKHLLHEVTRIEHDIRESRCEAGHCCVLKLLVAAGVFSTEVIVSILQWSEILLSRRNTLERLTQLLEYHKSVLDAAKTEASRIATSDADICCFETHTL